MIDGISGEYTDPHLRTEEKQRYEYYKNKKLVMPM